ncbi:M3 family metallopeptidase [Acidihalobacter ferrooxydans]|uniref:oligopeptidase A n=1 Tax=Acidihalobacter ferrooxydans TaxID=1765967 RepID=A0A1P8UCW1_9GAMM|nr:M3 family metallopeptidase [Acidihalobacter ferrooxydans]APZ41687.1 oligopeptidase A [Acidihalobacter ferrooxydans]
MSSNPLLVSTDHPLFAQIEPEHVLPAVESALAANRRAIDELLKDAIPRTWERFVEPLTALDEKLDRVWTPVRHLNAVANSKELRAAYNACLPKLSAYHTELGHNVRLYEAWKSLAEGPQFRALNTAQRKVVLDTLRDFRLSGVALPPEQKKRFAEIQEALSKLQSTFEENLLDATHAWHLDFDDEKALEGLPPSGLALARQAAEEAGKPGAYRITLDFPSYYGVMCHCRDQALREKVYTAYVTRASDQGPQAGQWDNSAVMHDILRLRLEAAQLLGYANFAQESLATKMADSPEQVIDFLSDLANKGKLAAERDLSDLRTFAAQELGLDELHAWDMAYTSERLSEHRFALEQEALKPYFPVDSVLQGLFTLTEKLFDVRIAQGPEVETWHKDIRFYEIRDPDGTLRAQFYLDLYARQHKRGGAWMDECVSRHHYADTMRYPIAFLTCNSTPPLGEQPALFTHDEVITLFHEFGHGLHHMLTRIDYPAVSGINGVEWDAVELPSQFMENWCWTREALDLFARHYETGETLPEAMLEALLASRDFQAGMQMLRQIEFSLFDMRLHQEYDPALPTDIQALLNDVRDTVAVVKPPAFNRFQHSFTHIFGGGYAAGYYSYKWAEVLSADAFARFEEDGLFNPATGHAFLHSILERGGSQPAAELFREFRGREPSVDALLRHHGIAA